RALLAVKRERPLTKKERDDRAAAAAAAANGSPPPEPTADAPAVASEDSPDYFVLDARNSVRAPGFLDSTAFRVTFVGQTAALRAFLNRLASFELPVLVREVEVEPASADESQPTATVEDTSPDPTAGNAASVVLSANPAKPAPKIPAPRPSNVAPIVAKPISKFTVTVEYIELVPPAAAV